MCATALLARFDGINPQSDELQSESTLGCKDHPSARSRTESGTLIAVASQVALEWRMKFKGIPEGRREGMYRHTAAKPFGVSLLVVCMLFEDQQNPLHITARVISISMCRDFISSQSSSFFYDTLLR